MIVCFNEYTDDEYWQSINGHILWRDGVPKSATELHEEGRRRRGRPMLRWEDCVKICEEDIRLEEEDNIDIIMRVEKATI